MYADSPSAQVLRSIKRDLDVYHATIQDEQINLQRQLAVARREKQEALAKVNEAEDAQLEAEEAQQEARQEAQQAQQEALAKLLLSERKAEEAYREAQEAQQAKQEAQQAKQEAQQAKQEASRMGDVLLDMLQGTAQRVVSLQHERDVLSGNETALENMSLASIATLYTGFQQSSATAAMQACSRILRCIACRTRTARYGYRCGHIPYCHPCLQQAMARNIHRACPSCRQPHNPFEVFGLSELEELTQHFEHPLPAAAVAGPSVAAVLSWTVQQQGVPADLRHSLASMFNQRGIQLNLAAPMDDPLD